MRIQKLSLEESISFDFECVAIHTPIEDYQLAYLINKNLNLRLKRTKEDLDIQNGNFKFPLFEWEDLQHQNKWYLIANVIYQEVKEKTSQQQLFEEDMIQIEKQFLIPELKQVDYFFQINQLISNCDLSSIIKTLNKIPQIVTSYELDPKKIKHIEHLTLE